MPIQILYMRKIITFIILIVCLLFFPVLVLAEGFEGMETWLVLEKGKHLYRQHEYGQALRAFREVLVRRQLVPESEWWIGRVFKQQHMDDLAIQQFERALEEARNFVILEEEYQLLYDLAEVKEEQGNYKGFEEALLRIVNETSRNLEYKFSNEIRTNMLKTLREQGIDKVIELYRIKETIPHRAYSQLGRYYFHTNRLDEASEKLLISVLITISIAIDELKKWEPEYEFESLSITISDFYRDAKIEEFLEITGLWQDLYMLANTSYLRTHRRLAEDLWSLIGKSRASAPWKNRALQQLANPNITQELLPEENT
jgi:tetratricopeptide (TPR) repeat protein